MPLTQTKKIRDAVTQNAFNETVEKREPAKYKVLYTGNWISVAQIDDYDFTIEKRDSVIMLPYDSNLYDELESVFFRFERCPAHNDKDNEYYAISEGIETGEEPIDAVVRGMKEECGIEISKDDIKKRIKALQPLFVSKSSTFKVYPYLVDVTGLARGELKPDGSKWEKLSSTIEIDVINLNKYNIRDIQLLYLLSVLGNATPIKL